MTHPTPAVLMAACMSAEAVLAMITFGDRGKETATVNMFLTYDGPAAFAEPQ